VRLDRRQLEQVFMNLILNAEHAMAETGGRLTLRVRPSQERRTVLVHVIDEGPGIDADLMDRIFEPFFSAWPKEPGTGLGLSAVQGLLEANQGTISVQSEAGQGTCFSITLPAAIGQAHHGQLRPLQGSPAQPAAGPTLSPTPEPNVAASEPAGPRREERRRVTRASRQQLLIAERDEALRSILSESLRHRGYDCLLAANESELTALLAAEHVDLLLLDLDLPELANGGVARQFAHDAHRPTIIGLAGNAFQSGRELPLTELVDVILDKPFELQRLLSEIETALRDRRVA